MTLFLRRGRVVRPTAIATGGFTLVELLIVIAIIAVLAAILFPVFAQARAKARQTVCASNLKQIGAAIEMYKQDFDGYYVPRWMPYPPNQIYSREYGNEGIAEWLKGSLAPASEHYLLLPYIKNDAVRLCPSRRRRFPIGGEWNEGRYTINGGAYPGTAPPGQPESLVGRPATTLLVWEHYWNSPFCGAGAWINDTGQPISKAELQHWDSSHHNGFNALWGDGHVKRMNFSALRRAYFTAEEDPD